MIKSFLVFVSLAFAFSGNIAHADSSIETGLYFAQDLEGGDFKAEINIVDSTNVQFRFATPDFVLPAPGCVGTYSITGSWLNAVLTCPDADGEAGLIPISLDITNVTPESVRSPEGAIVDVKIDILGPETTQFTVKKIDKPVLP